MENHKMLLKLYRLFPSSFTSCQARTRPDVVDTSISIAKSAKNISHITNSPSNSPISQKQPNPENNRSSAPKLKSPVNAKGPKCPPVRNHSSSSQSGRWFTSSDDRTRRPADGFDTDTFYSMSSNSGDSFRAKAAARRQLKGTSCDPGSDHALTRSYYDEVGCRRRKRRRRKSRGGIEEGVAVEKRSVDPYGDFMGSMVEMIIEKQMFGEEDLDRLLDCYLSLNKAEYHGIIFRVFYEICRTLLCN